MNNLNFCEFAVVVVALGIAVDLKVLFRFEIFLEALNFIPVTYLQLFALFSSDLPKTNHHLM